jgi:CheY-like chemotaxis protein
MLKKVLIIDDDEDIVDILKDYLEIYGLNEEQILFSSDPMEALEIFRKHKDDVSLLICDYYMPKSNGAELCEILKKNRPNVCVILQTGDSNIGVSSLKNVDYVLHKPYNFDSLKSIIDTHNFKEPTFKQERHEQREFDGKYKIAQVSSFNPVKTYDSIIFNQTQDGCGLILLASSILKINDRVSVTLSKSADSNDGSNIFDVCKEAQIIWIELINIDTIKMGIKYL